MDRALADVPSAASAAKAAERLLLERRLKELFETKLHAAMRMYLDTCARCGLCVESCHVYASMPETRYSPVGRAELVRKVFRRYFRLEGRIAPWLGEVLELNDDTLERLNAAAYSCTGCRRCVVHCPFGIDTQQHMGVAKALLNGADRSPAILAMLADMSIAKGESVAETRESFSEALRNLEPEVEALWPGKPEGASFIPYERKGARVLYVPLAGAHSIVSAAALMNAAGESWSLSNFEAVNFGAFMGDSARQKRIADRIVAEAMELGVEEVAVVECGTAYRVLRHMIGKQPFRVVAFVELIARYLSEKRITLDPRLIPERVTYHDPCQIARNGGVYEEPRSVIRAIASDFVELSPAKVENWCCGGGGGLVALGEEEFRMKSGKVKAEQLRASGAGVLVTTCENCHSQLSDLNNHYSLGMRVEFLSHLAAKALLRPRL